MKALLEKSKEVSATLSQDFWRSSMDFSEKLETLVVVRGSFASLAVSSPLTSIGITNDTESQAGYQRVSWRAGGFLEESYKRRTCLHSIISPWKEHFAHSDKNIQCPGLNQDVTWDGGVRNWLRPRLTQSFKRTGKSLWQKTHKRFRQELFAMERGWKSLRKTISNPER